MYQTVGQDAIELVARALDVPLYRKTISGQAIEQGSEYGARNSGSGIIGDETEDLYALLSTVKVTLDSTCVVQFKLNLLLVPPPRY